MREYTDNFTADREVVMGLSDLEKQAEAAAKAELDKQTSKAKIWFAANREEAIVLVCISLAVGLLIGTLLGYVIRGPHA
jgi:hypothetical protein